MNDNKLPDGYTISKVPCCDNCPAFDPFVLDNAGRDITGKRLSPVVACKQYACCYRAYHIGLKEKEGAEE